MKAVGVAMTGGDTGEDCMSLCMWEVREGRDKSQRETLGFMVWVSKWLVVLFAKTRERRE